MKSYIALTKSTIAVVKYSIATVGLTIADVKFGIAGVKFLIARAKVCIAGVLFEIADAKGVIAGVKDEIAPVFCQAARPESHGLSVGRRLRHVAKAPCTDSFYVSLAARAGGLKIWLARAAKMDIMRARFGAHRAGRSRLK